MYLLLSVDVEKGVDNATQRLALAVTDRLKEKNFRFETVDKTGQTTLRVALSEGQAPEPVEKEILDRFGEIKKGDGKRGHFSSHWTTATSRRSGTSPPRRLSRC